LEKRAEQVLPGSKRGGTERERVEGTVGRDYPNSIFINKICFIYFS
jgi:hypothetical protein